MPTTNTSDFNQIKKTFRKTTMCKNPATCTFGIKCIFAHSKSELRQRKCTFGANCNKGAACQFDHSITEAEDIIERNTSYKKKVKVYRRVLRSISPISDMTDDSMSIRSFATAAFSDITDDDYSDYLKQSQLDDSSWGDNTIMEEPYNTFRTIRNQRNEGF